MRSILLLAVVVAGVSSAVAAPAAVAVTHDQPGKKVTVTMGGEVFTEVVYNTYSKPILWPIRGPGGVSLTRDWPMKSGTRGEDTDHPHHKSLWFAHGSVNGIDFWKEGDFFNIGIGVNHNEKKWDAGLLLQGIFRDKGKFKLETVGLFTEADIKRGNEWLGDLYFRYLIDDKTTLKSYFEYLYKDQNYGSPTSPYFVGRREKYSLGLGATRVLSTSVEGEVYVKGFYMQEDEVLFPDPRGNRYYRGFSAGLQLISRF